MSHSKKRFLLLWLLVAIGLTNFTSLLPAQTAPAATSASQLAATREKYLRIGEEVDATLRRDVLDVWFPRTLHNERGGFRANFPREWRPLGKESKFSVFQGRMTWISSQIALRRPELKAQYLPIAIHGIDFITGTLWDKEKGDRGFLYQRK